MIVCVCRDVSERRVREAIRRGAGSLDELAAALDGAGQDCGTCADALQGLLDVEASRSHINGSNERPAAARHRTAAREECAIR